MLLPGHAFARSAVDFFNEISLLYGTITEFCTSQTCPVMSASAQFEYLWCDNQVRMTDQLCRCSSSRVSPRR